MADLTTIIVSLLIGAGLSAAGFVGRRWFERSTQNELLERQQKVLAIHKSLAEQNLTPAELAQLEQALTGKNVRYYVPTESRVIDPVVERLKEPPVTQAEMNRLAVEQNLAAQLEVNEVYSLLLRTLSGDQREMLKRSQKAWEDYRGYFAQLAASEFEGGSIWTTIYYSHLAELNAHRATELRRIAASVTA